MQRPQDESLCYREFDAVSVIPTIGFATTAICKTISGHTQRSIDGDVAVPPMAVVMATSLKASTNEMTVCKCEWRPLVKLSHETVV